MIDGKIDNLAVNMYEPNMRVFFIHYIVKMHSKCNLLKLSSELFSIAEKRHPKFNDKIEIRTFLKAYFFLNLH